MGLRTSNGNSNGNSATAANGSKGEGPSGKVVTQPRNGNVDSTDTSGLGQLLAASALNMAGGARATYDDFMFQKPSSVTDPGARIAGVKRSFDTANNTSNSNSIVADEQSVGSVGSSLSNNNRNTNSAFHSIAALTSNAYISTSTHSKSSKRSSSSKKRSSSGSSRKSSSSKSRSRDRNQAVATSTALEGDDALSVEPEERESNEDSASPSADSSSLLGKRKTK